MSITLFLLPFLLGCLVSVLYVEINRKARVARQHEIERHYEALLWKQLEQSQQLLQANKDLLADNIAHRQQYTELQQKHEKMLAALN